MMMPRKSVRHKRHAGRARRTKRRARPNDQALMQLLRDYMPFLFADGAPHKKRAGAGLSARPVAAKASAPRISVRKAAKRKNKGGKKNLRRGRTAKKNVKTAAAAVKPRALSRRAKPKRVAGRLVRRPKTAHPKKLAVAAPPRASKRVRTKQATLSTAPLLDSFQADVMPSVTPRTAPAASRMTLPLRFAPGRSGTSKKMSFKGPDLSALKAFLMTPFPQIFNDLMKRVQTLEKKLPKEPKRAAAPDRAPPAAKPKAVYQGPDPFLSKIRAEKEPEYRVSEPIMLEEDSKLKPKTTRVEAAPVHVDADDLLEEMNLKKKEVAPIEPQESAESLVTEMRDAQKLKAEAAASAAVPAAVKDAKNAFNLSFFSKKEKTQASSKLLSAKEADAKKEKPAEPPRDVFAGPAFKQRKRSDFRAFLSSLKYFGLMKERLNIIQSLATMLNAGLPIIDSLKALQAEARGRPQRKLLQRVIDAVENGSALWRALDDLDFFSPHAIALIRIGEEAGNLAENMKYLAIQQEKDHQLKQKVRLAMIYPSIVMVLMFTIVMGLGMFVLPNLIKVLYSLNVKLPLVTRIVIMFTELMSTYGAIGIPALIAFVILIIMLSKFTGLKVVTQWALFKIPGVGRLAREATIARFGVIMGGLLQAGVPVTESLHSLVEVTSIDSYKRLYKRLLDHVTVGDSFSKSFSRIRRCDKMIPPSVQQLIVTGEKSGSLAEIFMKVSDIYEKKANETAQKLPVILEPMILLFIGALVGTIAFSIIVPIYSIVGNVGRG